MKVEFCCTEFKNHVEEGLIEIRYKRNIVTLTVTIGINSPGQEDHEITLSYCPFCGKKIQIGKEVEFNERS